MPEVKDELIRVARNPLIKFSHSERFEFPLRVLISNNKSIDTFKEVFQIILEKDFETPALFIEAVSNAAERMLKERAL